MGSTTHISVIDNEGNAASVTTTHGEGSSYVIPGTGIMVNNMLGEADLNPRSFISGQKIHGYHQ
jgi:gamma-glutamyltranspeptidase/glutathione hydrolase